MEISVKVLIYCVLYLYFQRQKMHKKKKRRITAGTCG